LYGRTIGPWTLSLATAIVERMGIDQHTLAQAIALIALIAGTIEYIEMIGRRAARRDSEAELRSDEDTALRGLVRVFLSGK